MPPPKTLSAYERERKILDTVFEQNEPLILVLENPGKAHHAKQRLYTFLKLHRESGGSFYGGVSLTLEKGSRELLIDPTGNDIKLRRPVNGTDVETSDLEDFFQMKAPKGVKI